MTDEWIWISRWEDFQHYKPERDRGPAWIKDYPKQLVDSRYLELTDRQRALLADIRRVFAMTAARLPRDTRVVSRYRHRQTFRSDLETLNHAGYIEFVSREGLEQRLEFLYASRAPARSKEGEREGEVEELSVGESSSSNRSDETRTPRASPNGRAATSQLETLKAYVHRVWNDYPDKGVLVDELADRGTDLADATTIVEREHQLRQEANA